MQTEVLTIYFDFYRYEKVRLIKSVLLISGVHGNEITPISCLWKFYKLCLNENYQKEINYESEESEVLIDKITFVFGAAVSALRNCSRNINSETVSDLNRMFPVNDEKPEVLLKKLIDEHDVIIDVHSSPNITEMYLIDIDKYALSLIDLCNRAKVNWVCWYSGKDTIKKYILESALNGKIGLTLKLNGMDTIDTLSAVAGSELLFKLLSNIPKKLSVRNIPFGTEFIEIKAGVEGIYSEGPKVGTQVKKGDNLGDIRNLMGNVIQNIKSPCTGMLLQGSDRSYVTVGCVISGIQPYVLYGGQK